MKSVSSTAVTATPTPVSGRLDLWIDGVPTPVHVILCAQCSALVPTDRLTAHRAWHGQAR